MHNVYEEQDIYTIDETELDFDKEVKEVISILNKIDFNMPDISDDEVEAFINIINNLEE